MFVGGNAVTGFFDGQRRQARRFAQRSLGHRFTDAIDFGLIEARDFKLRAMRRVNQVASLLDGNKILVGRHKNLPTFPIANFTSDLNRQSQIGNDSLGSFFGALAAAERTSAVALA